MSPGTAVRSCGEPGEPGGESTSGAGASPTSASLGANLHPESSGRERGDHEPLPAHPGQYIGPRS